MTTPTKAKLAVSRELRETRRYLRGLVDSTRKVIAWLDAEMKLPSTVERGRRVAQVTNSLELQVDVAARFGLGDGLKSEATKTKTRKAGK